MLRTAFNHLHTDPTSLGLPAYASAASEPQDAQQWSANATSQKELLARQSAGARSSVTGQRDRTNDEKQQDARENERHLRQILILQSYERFQDTYSDTVTFYDDAALRVDDLQQRIEEKLQNLENETELLRDQKGEAVFQDNEGGFYKVDKDQREAVTDETQLESLHQQVAGITADGKAVRTEAQQARFVELTMMMTDNIDLRDDIQENRLEADALNQKVEDDHSLAEEADDSLRAGRDDVESRLNELEQRFDRLDASMREYDQGRTVDVAADPATLDNDLAGMMSTTPSSKLPFH